MNLRLLVGTLLLCVFVISCKKDSANEPDVLTGSVLPLRLANSWTYKHTADTNGVIIDSSALTMTASQLDTFGTEAGYRISNFILAVSIFYPMPVIWANRADGLYDIVMSVPPYPPSLHRMLPFPTYVGDTLRYGGYIVRTRALNELVVVPAGSFLCLSYDVTMNDMLVAQIYVTPNIGIIKCWQLHAFPRERLVDELLSHQLH